MMTRIKTILYTLLFSSAMEFQINTLLHHDSKGQLLVIVLYTFIALITFKTFPSLLRRSQTLKRGFWKSYTVHGLFGLIVIEWFLMKNTPFSAGWYGIVAQPAMFTWWGTIAAMPFLMQHESSHPYRRKILLVYGIYAILSTGLTFALINTKAAMMPIILLQPPFFFYFYKFYFIFARDLENTSPTENKN